MSSVRQTSKSPVHESEQFVLKIFNGPQTGAIIDLGEGERYCIGSDLSSDIVLIDDEVNPSHLYAEVINGEVTITPIEGEIAAAGTNIAANDSYICKPNTPIELGRTKIYIGKVDQLPGPVYESDSSRLDCSAINKIRAKTVEIAKNKSTVFPAVACFLFLLSAAFVVNYSPASAMKTDIERITELKHQIGPENMVYVKAVILPDGTISLNGFVENENDLKRLTEDVKDLDESINISVVSDERLLSRSNDLLNSFDMYSMVKAVESTKGEVIFSGLVNDENNWNSTVESIQRDLPEIVSVDDSDVLTMSLLEKKVEQSLADELPDIKLNVRAVDRDIVIQGIVDGSDKNRVSEALDKTRILLGNRFSMVLELMPREENLLDISIKSVVHGDQPYFIHENGKGYFEGAKLDSGHVVVDITTKNIIFRVDNIEIVHKLRD